MGIVSSGFSHLVIIRVRIEQGMKYGKIITVAGTSNNAKKFYGSFHKKKEYEANDMSANKRRSRSGRKQHQFVYKQLAYPAQYVQ